MISALVTRTLRAVAGDEIDIVKYKQYSEQPRYTDIERLGIPTTLVDDTVQEHA